MLCRRRSGRRGESVKQQEEKKTKVFSRENILTIPNALSLLRLILIPVFMTLYIKGRYYLALLVIAVSGLTDIADGKIARRFNMVSDFGKAFDPVVDKLSQAGMLSCLAVRFPHLLFLFALLAVKEIVSGILALKAIRSTDEMKSAKWHGKLTTVMVYTTICFHLMWPDVPAVISDVLILITMLIMVYSFSCYAGSHIRDIRRSRG